MVIGSFPLAKIIVFGFKRASKPVSDLLLWVGKHHPLFRKAVIIPPGQLYHNLETRSKIRMLRLKQPRHVPPLPAKQAIQLGANLLSEVFVMAIGTGLILFEVSRQMRNDEEKNQQLKEKERARHELVGHISADVDSQDEDIKWLKKTLTQERTYQDCIAED
ncbi:hypothetical protein KR009_008407 [Drosophila setifemur]|nr:hypothetical protein KR009_008407 [Drosophila setifemur]